MAAQASTVSGETAAAFEVGDRVRVARTHLWSRRGWTGTVVSYDPFRCRDFPYFVRWDDGNGDESCSAFELERVVSA